MLRHPKTEREQEYRKIWRQYKELQNHPAGRWVDVEEPFQNGWFREFELRFDIKRREDAESFQRALEKVNNTVYSKRQDFLVKERRTNKWVPKKQEPKPLSILEYDLLDDSLKKHFEYQQFYEKTWRNTWHLVKRYVFAPRFYLVYTEPQPYIVTQVWEPDGEIESQLQVMRNRFNRDNMWSAIYKAHGWSYHDHEYETHWKYRDQNGRVQLTDD